MKSQIFDTTLPEGAQAEGVSFSGDDKLHLAAHLVRFGVDYIEAGWTAIFDAVEYFLLTADRVESDASAPAKAALPPHEQIERETPLHTGGRLRAQLPAAA